MTIRTTLISTVMMPLLWFGSIAATPGHPQRLVVALGDSITYGYGLPAPRSENYAALFARHEGMRLVNLARSGYTCRQVLVDEVPKLPPNAALVIVNCGANDLEGAIRDLTPPELMTAEGLFTQVLSAVTKREPNAGIILVNLRYWQRLAIGHDTHAFARNVRAWNTMLSKTGLPVVDLADSPFSYQAANFQQPGLYMHPTIAGDKKIAAELELVYHNDLKAIP